jgi:multidrug efflux system membrane fusion protein
MIFKSNFSSAIIRVEAIVSGKRGLAFRQWRIALTSVAVAAILSLSLACNSGATKPTNVRAAGNQSVPVSVVPAVEKDMPVYLVGLGSVTPLNTVSVKSRVDGQLVTVAYKEGQDVKEGDLLAVVDPRPYQVALDQAQAQLFKDQASLNDAKLNYERYKGLLQDSGAMSQQQVDTQRSTVAQMEGAVRTDQAQIDNAKLNLAYCHITASISGRVGLRLVDPGNMVHAADTNPLLVITQMQPISVIFTLPEDQLPAVLKRMKTGALPVDAYSRDDLNKLAAGKLLTIDNQIDQTTGTGKLKAVFDNHDDALWPNQFVNVHLQLDVRKNSILIPTAAIQRGPQGTYVFVVKPDNTAEVRSVTVALSQNNMAAISQGVEQNDLVVVDGQDKLQAGTHVEPRTLTPGARQRQATEQTGQPAAPTS